MQDDVFLRGACLAKHLGAYQACAQRALEEAGRLAGDPLLAQRASDLLAVWPKLVLEGTSNADVPPETGDELLSALHDPLLAFLLARESGGSAEFILHAVMPTRERLVAEDRAEDAARLFDGWALWNSYFVEPPEDGRTP